MFLLGMYCLLRPPNIQHHKLNYLLDWMKAVRRPNMIRIALLMPRDDRGVAVWDRILHHGDPQDRTLKTIDNFFELQLNTLEARETLDLPETYLAMSTWFKTLEKRWVYFS